LLAYIDFKKSDVDMNKLNACKVQHNGPGWVV